MGFRRASRRIEEGIVSGVKEGIYQDLVNEIGSSGPLMTVSDILNSLERKIKELKESEKK